MYAIDNATILPTRGYDEVGTTYPLNISNVARPTEKTAFIKILSGFGGSNAGIAYVKGGKL
jgi:3-oxoacyl-[acyl-carrier-protein] synthase-1